MENHYGIGVKNRYDLFLDDEEDPFEILKQEEEERERKKAEKLNVKDKGPATKTTKGSNQTKGNTGIPASKTNTSNRKGSNENALKSQDFTKKEDSQRSKSTKAAGDGTKSVKFSSGFRDQKDFEENKNRRNREDKPPVISENRDRGEGGEFQRGRGGGGRGRGEGRGGRGRGRGRGSFTGGFGGYDSRGKREFDRQSGSDKSGVKPVDKREGGGAHNWGNLQDDIDVQLHPLSDENPEVGERSGDETILEAPDTKETDQEQEEGKENIEEPKEMTLQEWKDMQAGQRSVSKFNFRKAGEGEDQGQWKKYHVLSKKKPDEGEPDESEEEEDEYVRRGRQKKVFDIEINFSDSRRRGRGGRGTPGGRPRGGRGGGRGMSRSNNNSEQSAPKVYDMNDFPSLIAA